MVLELETVIAPRAWRVEFAESSEALPDGVETIEIAEPRNVTALLAPLAPSDALAEGGPQTAGALVVVWMPPGANTLATIERDVDEWVRGAGVEGRAKEVNVRADVRTVRAVWGEHRAVIYANHTDVHFALDAILRFSVALKEAYALEATMKSMWASIEADAYLTHAVTMRDQKMQRHVNEMTEVATRMKMAWLRVSRSIEQLDPALADPSKRLFAELVSAVSLYDRVEMLEDPVQFALDHYEVSNTRLIDMTLARVDRVNSIYGYGTIIILLIIQIWIMWPR
jgi:hypothetical protein